MSSHNKIASRVAESGMLVALAFLFSYIEVLIPVSIGIPGVKLGIANLVVLSCMYFLPYSQVLMIAVARVVLAGFLFGNLFSIVYSLAGCLFSFFAMLLLKKIKGFSMVGVSIIGGVFHNLGQLLVAVFVVSNLHLLGYLPVLVIAGAISGTLIGIVGKLVQPCIKYFKKID